MYCPLKCPCLAMNRFLNTSSSVNHSSSLKQANIIYPLGQSLLFPSSSFPHIFFGFCHFKLAFPGRHTIGKSQRCLSTICYTDQWSSEALCLSFPLSQILGCLWCQWYSWLRWGHVHLLMLPDDTQTWAEQHLPLCRNKAATKTDGFFSHLSRTSITFPTKSGKTKAYALKNVEKFKRTWRYPI